MKKILIVLSILMSPLVLASPVETAAKTSIRSLWVGAAWHSIEASIAVRQIAEKKFTAKSSDAYCYSVGNGAAYLVSLRQILDALDDNDEMLAAFPRRSEYLEMRNTLSELLKLLHPNLCTRLRTAKTDEQRLNSLRGVLKFFEENPLSEIEEQGAEIFLELLEFSKTWKS